MKNRLLKTEYNMIADEMIDSRNGFWVNGTPGVSDKFSRRLIEEQKKMSRLVSDAGKISKEDIYNLYEKSDKSRFINSSSKTLFEGFGSMDREPRIA
ncbi:MAG: hypothetical protein GX025_08010 [Clostridiales bacterium]|nr:hypothetical protein [Clostridiales bacterium]